MTDAARAERLAALADRRVSASGGRKRRPAEAARILVAGAGTAAMLAMTAAMARHDQANEAAIVATPPLVLSAQTLEMGPTVSGPAPAPALRTGGQPSAVAPAQTVTVITPTRAATVRTNGSR
jgi:hypothetical protein